MNAKLQLSSLATLGVPVIGVISGFIFLDENPQLADIIGLALILLSLFIVLKPHKISPAE